MPVSWRGFYAIVDPAFCRRSPLETADAILAGRCCAVLQLRDKRGDDRETLALARALKSRAAAASVPFVMNDRLDLALLAEASLAVLALLAGASLVVLAPPVVGSWAVLPPPAE